MLVEHVRDEFHNPVATVVAIGPGRLGVSVCNPKDRFNKRMGVKIAAGRAAINVGIDLPNNRYVLVFDTYEPLSDVVESAINRMHTRSLKYYK